MRNTLLNTFAVRNLLLVVSTLIIMSSCDKELAELDENKVLHKLSVQDQELINATNSLSLDILRAEYAQNTHGNTMFSPVSVGMALGMIYNGVGDTEKLKIQRIMGVESLIEKEINKSYNELLSFLKVSNDQLDISCANSLWFSYDVNINEDYRTKVMAYYDAEISELNFGKPSSIELINSWGNVKTNGNFHELIKVTPYDYKGVFLINAFSLNTTWRHNTSHFQTARNFVNDQGENLEVNTNNWAGLSVKLTDNDEYSFIEIPFENAQFLLSVVQPQQTGSLNDFVQTFSFEDLAQMSENSFEHKANVSLPEINFSSDKSIKSTLSNMGLSDLFLSSTDLSPSFNEINTQISDVNHLAKISLGNIHSDFSEKSFSDSHLMSLHINKPFIYFVKEKHSKAVLFAGYYTNPE